MTNASPILTQFNAGELSPLLTGRVDTEVYPKGCRTLQNFLPTPQGAAERRGGTRYLGGAAGTHPVLLIPFVRSPTESYMLELSGSTMRFWFNGALLTAGPVYTIGTPYVYSDLFNADGTAAIQVAQSADVMYFAHPKYPAQKLQHFSTLNWTMTQVPFADGPWLDLNTDLTNFMQVSDISGTGVTVTATNPVFTSGCVGQLIRITQNDLSQLKAWYPGQRTTGGNLPIGALRRSAHNTYKVVGTTAATPPSGTVDWVETGSDTLIATSGNQWDGPQDLVPDPNSTGNWYGRGVQWQYQDSGYGVGVITGYTDSRHVTIAVLRQFPLSLKTTGGSFVASNVWRLGAWSQDLGYPSTVCFFRERLTFGGGIYVWMSVAGDFENFADMDFGVISQDNAVTEPVISDVVNQVRWFSPADVLLVGTDGAEYKIGQNTLNEPFGPLNVAVKKQSAYGSRSITPVRIGGSSIFVTRTGRYVREYEYDFATDTYESHDLTLPSEHITLGGVIAMQWAFNPRTVVWMALGANNTSGGNLIGFTFNKDQHVQAWHNHPLPGGQVMSMAVVPSIAGDYDELHLCVKRTINGVTVYYIERLEQPWRVSNTQASAFYVDCGGTYSGAPTTTVSGLGYLEGQTVQVFADGQPQANKVVTGGSIPLDVPASTVQVGLACPAILQPMRIEAGGTDGTSQGKIKRINKIVWRFLNSLGGKYGRDVFDGSPLDELSYSDAPNPVANNTIFYTGDTLRLPWPGGYEQEGFIGYINDQPLPVTICAIMPAEVTYEGW
jgi:hypothetical protein